MSIKPPIPVTNMILAERHEDRNMILTLSTKVGEFEFEFTSERWQKLAESARWFHGQQYTGEEVDGT